MRYVYPSVGNDPEIFITERGQVVPAEKILKEPLETPSGYGLKEYKVKVDNAAVELNFPPATCLQVGISNMTEVLRKLKKYYLKPKIHSVCLKAAMELSIDDMKRYASLMQFGCDPSLLFYDNDLKISQPVVDPRTVRYRSTGYHVHLGLAKPNYYAHFDDKKLTEAATLLHTTSGRVRLVRMCDMIVGLPAVLLERDTDAVNIRRNVLGYGRAGEFREQPHGFEYRTLGPWPMMHPIWGWWANSAVRDALQLVLAGVDEELIKKIPGREISDTINTNDMAKALRLWTVVKRTLKDLVSNGRTENGKHAILGLNNIRMFEFAVATGGLKGAHFSFTNWLRGKEWSIKTGFPSSMKRKTRNSTNFNKFVAFSRKWELTRDNISEWL